MMETVTIPIARILDTGICVSASDGQRLHDAILQNIVAGRKVILSFEGVTRMTTAFLNAGVGQLYGEYSEEELRRQLGRPVNVETWHTTQLQLVINRAKTYFRDSESRSRTLDGIMGYRD